jgi:hypothetical protein
VGKEEQNGDIMKTYYKVVSKFKNNYYSAVFEGLEGGVTRYYPGEFVSTNPNALAYGFGLTFFENLIDAQCFCRANANISVKQGELEIWKIEIKGKLRKLPKKRIVDWLELQGGFPNLTYVGALKKIYNKENKKTEFPIIMDDFTTNFWPEGTGMAKEIKLISKFW